MPARRIVILTDGHTNPITAKTASCVVRYKPKEVVALLDTTQPGRTSQELLGVGGAIPVVAKLADAPDANTLMIGIAPSGGKLPAPWRKILLEAIDRGMSIVSGLHDFISNDAEIAAAAASRKVEIYDVRKNNERDVANRRNLREDCLRIHTVGQDCSVGKMLASVEITLGLKARGYDAKFVATGQTGIMIEGDGCPVDCVVSDFVNGAVEKLILANQHHDILLVEGQGSLSHPRYSAVTAGLLHGCVPHGMIMVYEAGRQNVLWHGLRDAHAAGEDGGSERNDGVAGHAVAGDRRGDEQPAAQSGRCGNGTRARAARVGRARVRRDSPRTGRHGRCRTRIKARVVSASGGKGGIDRMYE